MDDPNKNGGPALPSDAASPTAQSSRPTELISEPALPTSGQGNQDTGAKKSPANGAGDDPGKAKPICFDDPTLESSEDDPMGIKLHTHHPRVALEPDMRNLERDIFAVEHVIPSLTD